MSRPSSWETNGMTSVGRERQHQNRRTARFPAAGLHPRPDQGSQYVFNVSDLSTNYNYLCFSLSPSLFSPFFFLVLSSSSPICRCLSTFLSLFLPDSVVTEARSHALLLAGCSVRSFCRCRGLYAAFGKEAKRGGRGWMDG